MQKFGAVTRVDPEKLEEYKRLHAEPWAGVLETLKKVGIQNYSIFLHQNVLFSYLEFVGQDWEAAKQIIAIDPITQAWWKLTDPCQNPFSDANGQWSDMEQIFFIE